MMRVPIGRSGNCFLTGDFLVRKDFQVVSPFLQVIVVSIDDGSFDNGLFYDVAHFTIAAFQWFVFWRLVITVVYALQLKL